MREFESQKGPPFDIRFYSVQRVSIETTPSLLSVRLSVQCLTPLLVQKNVIELVDLTSELQDAKGSVPSRVSPSLAKEARTRLEASGHKFLQLKRLTLDMTEDSQIPMISGNNSFLSSFDLVAVQPSTEKILLAAAQSLEIDLISFDVTRRLNFRIRTAVARQAVDNGIMFEICLGDSLRDSSSRKNAIANARRVVEATKGKNIIITTGASDPLLLRGPYDLINLAHLCGFEAAAAKKALVQNPRALLLHAMTRKTYKGVADMQLVSQLTEHMKWTIPEQYSFEDGMAMALDKADNEESEDTESHAMEVDEPEASSSATPKAIEGFSRKEGSKGKRKRPE